MLKDNRVGIIGCGNMGSTLIKGILLAKVISAGRILACDVDRSKADLAKRRLGVKLVRSNKILAKKSDIIILAVKPKNIDGVLKEISGTMTSRKLLISIAAGITIQHIQKALEEKAAIVRAMPNMPGLVGAGISAVSFNRLVKASDKIAVRVIFSSLGEVVDVGENLMDAVTAISGSGPAYFFYLVELLIAAGMKLGLSKDTANKLAVKTISGSAKILEACGEDSTRLRARVTSKGGTTEAAFKVFKRKRLDKVIKAGVQAAARRAKELSGR